VLLHQPHRTLPDFRGKFVRLVHGSILSKIGASSKPGAIQGAHDWKLAMNQFAILYEERFHNVIR
jgi:hypothetical protein